MNQDRHKRKMSAIFSADVVGYSRLMESDEEWTIKSLEENKSLIFNLIEEYNGRVVDAPGDNILAEFSSVTNAVECAVKIQEELKAKNSRLKEEHQMEFRIGINLGEIVEEGERIYGSGVNIAARIEGLSKSGGICISGRTYDHIKSKFDFGYEFLGEHNVKNITEAIRVYRVLMEAENAGKVIGEKKTSSWISQSMVVSAFICLIIIAVGIFGWKYYFNKKIGEDKPKTIAVLPFDDLSPEKNQEHFALGISEEILNSISSISGLHVTSKTSSFSFKDTSKTVQEIADILNREYILEGSVRKDGDKLRITAQLINVADDRHLWSKTYNRELKDIFAIQEDIATAVADELKVTLGISKSLKKLGGTDNSEAYESYLIAKGQYNEYQHDRARKSIDAAIALDPNFALAWALNSLIHVYEARFYSGDQVSLEFDAALDAALRAIELEPALGQVYLTLGSVYSARGEFIKAELAFRKGMELTTKTIDYFEYGLFGHYINLGYLRKSNEILEGLLRNDPFNLRIHATYMLNSGYLGNMERAEELHERGKAIFVSGDLWVFFGDFFISWLRLGTKEVLSTNEIQEIPTFDTTWAMAKKYIASPDEGLSELRLLYNSEDNLTSSNFLQIGCWGAYFGDPTFALNAMERSVSLNTTSLVFIWGPVFKEVRRLPRFKEFVREIGLVDYWKEYGWPDLCRPVGDDDFVCD